MKVHHIGYAVNSIEKASKAFEELGYTVEGEAVYDAMRNINILFVKNGECCIELIERANKELPSPVDVYAKNGGAQPYHMCYEVQNLEEEIQNMMQKKFILIDGAKEAPAIGGCRVAFLYKRATGIIELVEM